ncbi:hypothetical protein FWF64_02630 [Candidatus Saccharibacteria bacterium]|nr:hypothetical protein [Candidatus Saccharibacteria bacterium]
MAEPPEPAPIQPPTRPNPVAQEEEIAKETEVAEAKAISETEEKVAVQEEHAKVDNELRLADGDNDEIFFDLRDSDRDD